MSCWRATIVAALSFAGLMASPASAAPSGLGTLKEATATVDSSATKVHWRRYRHCHWRHGHRRCHGRSHYRSYGLPGVGIYFGSRTSGITSSQSSQSQLSVLDEFAKSVAEPATGFVCARISQQTSRSRAVKLELLFTRSFELQLSKPDSRRQCRSVDRQTRVLGT